MISLSYPQSLAIPSATLVAICGLSTLAPIDWRIEFLLALAGLASWTLVEYLIHRFVLHGIEPFQSWHLYHHLHPELPMRIPVAFSLILVLTLGMITALSATFSDHVVPFAGGLSLGYLLQEIVHHRLHASTRPFGFWISQRWSHHNDHHHVDQNTDFGTLTGFWDKLV